MMLFALGHLCSGVQCHQISASKIPNPSLFFAPFLPQDRVLYTPWTCASQLTVGTLWWLFGVAVCCNGVRRINDAILRQAQLVLG